MSRKQKHRGLSFYQKKEKKISVPLIKEVFSYILTMVIAMVIAVVLTFTFGMSTNVVGVSMEPTLSNSQTIYINRFAYTLASPEAGDVIVFLPNGNQNSHYYVKRVIATPTDKLQIIDGVCFVNGIQSPYVNVKILDAGIAENEIVLGAGEYFCIGDNPNNSEDSRSANIGPVETDDIIGKAWFHLKSDSDGVGFIE